MMKTTKRVIKIPASKNHNKFLFQPIDRVDIMFPFNLEDSTRKPIEPRLNPLTSLDDFNKKSWADDIILLLRTWINEDNLAGNLNMAAKLAYHNTLYSQCLGLLLGKLKIGCPNEQLYLTHTVVTNDEEQDNNLCLKKDEQKIVITNVMSKRIKDISMSILNEEPCPVIDQEKYKELLCCCDELKHFTEGAVPKSIMHVTEQDLSIEAAKIIDNCITIFPVNSELWENCFRLSKNFYLENNLSMAELETVLRKFMESDATTMAAAIMYSKDCSQYSQILSPKFYLNMCSQVLDTWG